MNIINYKAFVLIIFPITMILFTPVSQSDTKLWSGNMCQPKDIGDSAAIVRSQNGSLYNNSSEWIDVTCAITREWVRNTTGTQSAFVYVQQNDNQTTFCFLFESRHFGRVVSTASGRRAGSGWLSVDTQFGHGYGHRSIECQIPPKGRIIQIRMAETAKDGAD